MQIERKFNTEDARHETKYRNSKAHHAAKMYEELEIRHKACHSPSNFKQNSWVGNIIKHERAPFR